MTASLPTTAPARQEELDLLKALCIFEMIMMHLQENIFSHEYADMAHLAPNYALYLFDNLAYLTGPLSFLFSMGCTTAFSRKQEPRDLMKRGFQLLDLWLVVNFPRALVRSIRSHIVFGTDFTDLFFTLMFGNDVLCFAGIFFLVLALFRRNRTRAKDNLLLTIAAIMSLLGWYCGCNDIGKYFPSWTYPFLRPFLPIDDFSAFPLANWLIVPVIGMVVGKTLKRCSDKRKYYGWMMAVCAPLSAGLLWFGIESGFFRTESLRASAFDPLGVHLLSLPVLAIALALVGLTLSAFYFATRIPGWSTPGKAVRFLSSNLTAIYVAHWLILPVMSFFVPWGDTPWPPSALLATTLAVLAASAACATAYRIILINCNRSKG